MALQSRESPRTGERRGQPSGPRSDRSTWERLLWMAAVVLATLAASFVLWDPLNIDERTHVRRIARHSAEGVRADLEAEMKSLVLAQVLLARSWAARSGLTRQEWEHEAGLFLDHHPSCALVRWVDPNQASGRWELHREGQDQTKVLEPPPPPIGTALDGRSGGPGLTPVFRRPDGRATLRVVVPVHRRGAPSGSFVAVFDLEAALGEMLLDHRALGYSISIREGDEIIYRTPGASLEHEAEWAEGAEPRLPGVAWNLHVWPTPELLAEMRSPLPELALVLGALLGLFLVLAVHFARAAGLRSQELGRARDEVERRVEERTAELQRANEKLQAEVAERARAAQALRNLSGRILRLQDEERRRLARELHDSTAQILGAVAVGLDRARRSVRHAGNAEVDALLEDSAEHLQRVTQEIRTLSFLLHPPLLDDLGLEYVLPWYAEGFSRRSGIAVSLDVPRDLGRLPQEVELTLYRIVQEGLTNVHHHSGSRTASITLFRDPGSVTLEIMDQGRGIRGGPDRGNGTVAELGVGVTGMRERVRQLGGELDIGGDEGGTVVRVVLPVPVPETPAARQGENVLDAAV